MKALVLDTRNGDRVSDLFIIDPYRRTVDSLRLNYVPELQFDDSARELLVVETDRTADSGASYWLKMFDGDTLELVRQIQTPMRPMYTGFPNRSTRVKATGSGRYVLVQELCRHPRQIDVYRTRVRRYDRISATLEQGEVFVDSCLVDFGNIGASDDDLYFHLCCEKPSVVAFGSFDSAELQFTHMTALPPRKYSLQETCGSWLDVTDQSLFCTSREGSIYRVHGPSASASLWTKLPIALPRTVPLQHVYGSGRRLYIGVAANDRERSLSVASEIWELSLDSTDVLRVIELPSPVINFVSVGSALILGVDPYRRVLYFIDLPSGKLVDQLSDLGVSPAEVQWIS